VLIDLPKDVQMADASHLPAHASLPEWMPSRRLAMPRCTRHWR
jgi:hypothetical protein